MLVRKYFPGDAWGDVRDYLESLRAHQQRRKAAVRIDLDLQTLEEFWPRLMNVDVKMLQGWAPLKELRREYDKIAYRIFFCVRGRELWLLSAFEKHASSTPRRELEKAYSRMKMVMEKKRG